MSLYEVLKKVHQCQLCAHQMTHPPTPVIRGLPSAKILIIGQAPGLKAHQTRLSFNDPSGDRLREWMAIERSEFYDENKIAIMPMGFCFPGRNEAGADLPPLKKCAPFWHYQLLSFFPNIRLTLLVGSYAQKYYLKERFKGSLTNTLLAFEEYLPDYFCLPHPSWRNTDWINNNPWFEEKVLPRLKNLIREILQ